MKLLKISPKFQITIPKTYHHLCANGWFALTVEDKILTLRPIEIQEAKTDQEYINELIKNIPL
ncbi:MAG: hypothetical protein WCX95_01645 [Candidatus Gracilibacteria bacterium]